MCAGQITDEEYKKITGLIYARFGIYLSEKKRVLVTQRLQKLLRDGGFNSFGAYYDYVIAEETGEALVKMIDVITTNHTSFFREKDHFDFLTTIVLPEMKKKMDETGDKTLRIWSAGCSSGEEPYTLAMTALDFFEQYRGIYEIAILATDISVSVLAKAINGIYAGEQALKQVPAYYKQKYMEMLDENRWIFSDEIKKHVHFRKLNLKQDDFPFSRKFHIIFCRNVMIYFDQETRRAITQKLERYLAGGGYLFLGHSESLDRSFKNFEHLKNAQYRSRRVL